MLNISFSELFLILIVSIVVINPKNLPEIGYNINKLHLIELRDRIIRSLVVVTLMFGIFFLVSNQLYDLIALPLLAKLPSDGNLVAIKITAPFLIPMKLCVVSSITVSMPFILYQIWAFVAPGLYKHERRAILPLVIISCILFYLGMCFSFWVICPVSIGFFTQSAPSKITVMADMADYLDFILAMLFASGVAFQIPIITVLLIKFEIVTKQQLTKYRPIVIVGAFVLGMLLTPPDVISQILLAIPMLILFELGVIMGFWPLR